VALLGIVLVALNLRIAVTVVSPITDAIRPDVALTQGALEVLAAAPPLVFALSGLAAAGLGRRFGLEIMLAAAMALSAAGELLRALSSTPAAFLAWTVPIMVGAGLGNVLCPPAIKKHFPDRIGLVTGLYTGCISFSTALPPLFVARIAEAAGWRPALGVWVVLTVAAVIPWAWIVFHPERRGLRLEAIQRRLDPRRPGEAPPALAAPVWRAPLAWCLALVFACNSLIAYSLFAWLPDVLREAGFATDRAASYLAILSIASLPGSLLVPVVIARVRRVWLLPPLFFAGYVVGFLGLALSPAHGTLAWILASRVGDCFFPFAITLIALRTRTLGGATALSGFVQSLGYLLAAAGPWLIGALFSATGSWHVPMLALLVFPPVQLAAATVAARLGRLNI